KHSTPRSCARDARTSPATAHTSRRSASAWSRSTGPARTSSPSSATAPAPWTTYACASPCASPLSPPRSHSTTASAAPVAPSPATPHNPRGTTHLGLEAASSQSSRARRTHVKVLRGLLETGSRQARHTVSRLRSALLHEVVVDRFGQLSVLHDQSVGRYT